MIESSVFFVSEIIGLISWGIKEMEKYLTVFSLCRFKDTSKKLCVFVTKRMSFFIAFFLLKNKIEENLTAGLAERCRGKKYTYRFICHFCVAF
jgi:hypothetical protein